MTHRHRSRAARPARTIPTWQVYRKQGRLYPETCTVLEQSALPHDPEYNLRWRRAPDPLVMADPYTRALHHAYTEQCIWREYEDLKDFALSGSPQKAVAQHGLSRAVWNQIWRGHHPRGIVPTDCRGLHDYGTLRPRFDHLADHADAYWARGFLDALDHQVPGVHSARPLTPLTCLIRELESTASVARGVAQMADVFQMPDGTRVMPWRQPVLLRAHEFRSQGGTIPDAVRARVGLSEAVWTLVHEQRVKYPRIGTGCDTKVQAELGYDPGRSHPNYVPIPSGELERILRDYPPPFGDATKYLFESVIAQAWGRGWKMAEITQRAAKFGRVISEQRLSQIKSKPTTLYANLHEFATYSKVFDLPLSDWLFALNNQIQPLAMLAHERDPDRREYQAVDLAALEASFEQAEMEIAANEETAQARLE